MNDVGTIKEIIESYGQNIEDNSKFLVAIFVFLLTNILLNIIGIFSDHKLKDKEKKIFSFTLKEKRRIEIFEKIYQLQDALTIYDGRNNNTQFLSDVQSIENFVSQNKIYLSKEEQAQINQINDYFKTVLVNHRMKNYIKEAELFNKMEELFRK